MHPFRKAVEDRDEAAIQALLADDVVFTSPVAFKPYVGKPITAALLRGVLHAPEGWRLTQDPSTFAVAGAPFASLVSSSQAPVALARGEHDPMVSLEELRAHARLAYDIPGAGHNVHVEDPRAVLGLIEMLLRGD